MFARWPYSPRSRSGPDAVAGTPDAAPLRPAAVAPRPSRCEARQSQGLPDGIRGDGRVMIRAALSRSRPAHDHEERRRVGPLRCPR